MVKYSDHVEPVAWCAVLLGFTMFLGSSNLVPWSTNLFDPGKQLTRADLTMAANLLMAHIRWSKVIQYRQQDLKVPISLFPDDRICPVFWCRNMLQKIPGKASDSLFAVYIKGRAQALSYNQLSLRLHKWLLLVGEDASKFSLHSLCRCGAFFPYESNMSDQMIKILGQ